MAGWPDTMTDDNTPQRQCRPAVKTSLKAKEASDANTLLDCIAKLTIPCASQVILKKNLVFFILKINMFPYMELWKLREKHMKNSVIFPEAALKSAIAKNSLRIPWDFAVF